MEGNLAVVLAERARTYGWWDRPLFFAGQDVLTHGDVHVAIARASGVLHAVGVREGRRVLIALPDSVGFVAALFGTLRLGALAVLVGPEQPHEHVMADALPDVVVCLPEAAARFADAQVVTVQDLADEPTFVPDAAKVDGGAPAYVQYTSGTTGDPKGAVHRHGDAAVYFQAMALGALGMTPDDRVLSLSRASYPYGLGALVFFPMMCGGSSVLVEGTVTVFGAAEQAARHRPTLLFGVPGVYERLVEGGVGSAFQSVRAAASAGEPLLAAAAERIEDVLGCPVLDGLGSTEVGHTFVSNTVTRRKPGALGVVLDPYEIDVRAADGRVARRGERGVLYVRGPSVMAGYLGGPEPQGWLCTGDLVHLDADGFVHHHGRVADQVMVMGERVAPLEIERVLGRRAGVVEVAVVCPKPPVLRAFVVLAGGARVPEEELLALAREALPAHKVPRSVTFLDVLPRTARGKIDREGLGRMPL